MEPKRPRRILVIDDDASVTASLGLLLEQHGHEPQAAEGPEQALSLLAERRCDLVVQDMNFSRSTTGEEGLDLFRRIRERHPDLPVLLLTAWGSIELAVEGMKAGATDFMTKPWDNQQLLRTIDTTLALADDAPPSRLDRAELDRAHDFGDVVGEHPSLLEVLGLVGRVAPTDASVLITGESGTGKEVVAEAIHRNSHRRDRPFVKVNLGGISSTLFESEMFGHVRGAFTDARDERQGRFELADGGTIFLDEIGEVEPAAQVKLLRVLQDRSYEVLGSSQTRRVDVRVIAATNRDLPAMVQAGEFREDLLYRLNLISIELPPLKQRGSDVRLLAAHFLDECRARYDRPELTLTSDGAEWLETRPWPGNIRQLRQTLERAVLVSETPTLSRRELVALADLRTGSDEQTALPEPGSMTLDELERRMIEKCLAAYQGNVSRAARALGLSRASLYRRCEKYGLELGRE
ncbi:MAG: sigma-54 dependent transcriptional regulator [Acidobacteriota bacterium]